MNYWIGRRCCNGLKSLMRMPERRHSRKMNSWNGEIVDQWKAEWMFEVARCEDVNLYSGFEKKEEVDERIVG